MIRLVNLEYNGPNYDNLYEKDSQNRWDIRVHNQALLNQLVSDPRRNELIGNTIKSGYEKGSNILCLSDRISQMEILNEFCRNFVQDPDDVSIDLITGIKRSQGEPKRIFISSFNSLQKGVLQRHSGFKFNIVLLCTPISKIDPLLKKMPPSELTIINIQDSIKYLKVRTQLLNSSIKYSKYKPVE